MKKLRRNQAKFMTKELKKAIMDRSRFNGHHVKTFWHVKRQKPYATR